MIFAMLLFLCYEIEGAGISRDILWSCAVYSLNILMFLHNTRDIHVIGKFRIDIRRHRIVRFLVDIYRIEMKKKKVYVYARSKSAQL